MIDRLYSALKRRCRALGALISARRASHWRLSQSPAKKILVVCYGNIYRSPFVGAYLREHLAEVVDVRTAGFHSIVDRPSPDRHIKMCRTRGIDLSDHRSKMMVPEDLVWADIVLFMDRYNWSALDALGAEQSKLVWLGAFGSGPLEIADPYNHDEAYAAQIIESMECCCRAFVSQLCVHPEMQARRQGMHHR